ncbi:MAG TPA: nuclear transport factor 2 family protein [Kofleriaceae bacterium]|nr:nuclear transport factor 2 family protein [Kofleriaceae bacterium]
MRGFTRLFVALVLASPLAFADSPIDRAKPVGLLQTTAEAMSGLGQDLDIHPPRFGFDTRAPQVAPKDLTEARGTGAPIPDPFFNDSKDFPPHTVAYAADHKSAWVATDLERVVPCGNGDCRKRDATPLHATAIYDQAGGWQPLAWLYSRAISDADQAKVLAGTLAIPGVGMQIDDDARDAAALYRKTFPDPKALAATVSDRGDVVLYGSAPAERFVGGAKVRAKLAAWNLAFEIDGGVRAGATSSKTVAWVASNVLAKPPTKPTARGVPYRVLAIYERTDRTWKLVQVHFSFIEP